jgi:CelD/BcsL family acetyltransferase involved in cellulose biosynthesis
MLRAEVISQLSPQDRLAEEWSDLADGCARATVFQTPEWLATWWSAIGSRTGGRSLYIVTIRDGGKLVGLAPLMLTGWYVLPIKRLSFLGMGVTDYNDVIAEEGREDEVCEALFAFLSKRADWHVLDFRELRDGGLLRDRPPSPSLGFAYSDWPLEACPYLALPNDVAPEERWPRLLAGYSKKTRSNIGYYERNLQRAFRVETVVISDEEQVAESLQSLFELHRRRWNRRWLPGVFATERVRSFHIAAARRLLLTGKLRLHVMRLDDEVQAALYAFAYHDRTCYYQGGFEPELARYSLGSVLIANAVKLATEEGFATFDFLRGNEEYKERWTGGVHAVNIRRLVAREGSSRLAFAERVHRLESRAETRLKGLFAGGIVRQAPRATERTGQAPPGL